jgi:dipeptidyl aminopeptidase/acylaminoacyl peptidase
MLAMTENETTKAIGFYQIDLASGQATRIFERIMHVHDEIVRTDVSEDNRIAFAAEDVAHTEDIWVLGANLNEPRRVTTINSQLENVEMGKSLTISWLSLDGERLHGALLLPADYEEGKRYPLIVNVYGGDYQSSLVNRFGFFGAGSDNMQILATRGYAVLLPDAPLKKGSPRIDLLKTVVPGVNRAVELGFADPDRLGVMGHSYGGYSTLALITQTTMFRAAMASAAASNLISHYGYMTNEGFSSSVGWAETGQGNMLGTPWQYRDMYIENSPLFYLDRVETPLLLIHSAGDRAVPVSQSEETFVALRRLGKEATFVKYTGEDHWQGLWGSPNVVDYWNRVISWFDDHLKMGQGRQSQTQ